MTKPLDGKCLASWAVFRRLYDNDRQDSYSVLKEFIISTIYRHTLRTFTINKLTSLLKSDYEFELPEAVVSRAAKKLNFKKENGEYSCNPMNYDKYSDFSETMDSSVKCNNELISLLYAYVEKSRKESLTDSGKKKVLLAFVDFMLNKNVNTEYAEELGAFILQCRNDPKLSGQLNTIREGVVLYFGIKYNISGNASERWTDELTIVLDTEILFHMAGYNGEICKRMFEDFFKLVNEINSDSLNKTRRKLIHFRFFKETHDEYERFFSAAESIINGEMPLKSSVTAMKSITEGCRTASDIIERKVEFENILKTHGIRRDENEDRYYSASEYKNNIEDPELIKSLQDELHKGADDIADSLRSLSHIYILRGGRTEAPFEKVGYILLTDNYITKQVAWNPAVRETGGKLLCTDLCFFTDRLWCKLGKGFSKNDDVPKVFDSISKAQVILSNLVNAAIAEKYDELFEKVKTGEVTQDGALEILYKLRSEVMKPEDIDTGNDVRETLTQINERRLENYIAEREQTMNAFDEEKEKNRRLEKQLAEQKNQIEALVSEQQEAKKQEERRLAKKEFSDLRKKYKQARSAFVQKQMFKRYKLILSLFLFVGIMIVILIFQDWLLNQNWIIKSASLLGTIVPIIMSFIDVNPLRITKQRINRWGTLIFKYNKFSTKRDYFINPFLTTHKSPSWHQFLVEKGLQ